MTHAITRICTLALVAGALLWEPFIWYGEDAALVGIVPVDLHVGYEAELSRLVGIPSISKPMAATQGTPPASGQFEGPLPCSPSLWGKFG